MNKHETAAPLTTFTKGRPGWQRCLIGLICITSMALAGCGRLMGPDQEIGGADDNAPRATIRNCEDSWLNRQVDGLKKRCYQGNLAKLATLEEGVFGRYDVLLMQWPQLYTNAHYDTPPTAKEVQEIRQLWLPEENFFRDATRGLQEAGDLRSLMNAQALYLGRITTIAKLTSEAQERLARRLESEKKAQQNQPKPDTEPGPYSMIPSPGSASVTVPITGKSGPFNVYAIEPKDDLDALHYFVGHDRVEPDAVAGMLPIIEQVTAQRYGLNCEYLCADAQGNIVGRTRIRADDHPAK